MSTPSAAEALSPEVTDVIGEARPVRRVSEAAKAEAYAVFSNDFEAHDARFLGVVTERDIARHPQRIFEDILPRDRPAPLAPDTPLDEALSCLNAHRVDALPVVHPSSGDLVGIVTRASLLEALLRRERESLKQMLARWQSAENERMRLQAECEQLRRESPASESIAMIASGIGHDLNNLLMIIGNCVTRRSPSISVDEDAGQEREDILRAIETASTYARHLLELGFASASRSDLNMTVARTAAALRRSLPSGTEVVVRLESSLPPVAIVPIELSQVVLNLALNARDAMPKGGSLQLVTRLDSKRAWVELEVRDTGVGIHPDDLERIFEPLFTRGKATGTGLGLALVRRIVDGAGGEIAVSSRVGCGTVFRVTLPVSDPATTAGPLRE